jgi:peptidoglycan/xylan/chitin deacetylase (PgdA/CDA1 family)
LRQDGPELVWRVVLSHPFSPGALARDRRSLCLLLERAQNASVAGQVCVAGPARRGMPPRLEFMRVTGAGAGPEHPIATATITRKSAEELTASFPATDVSLRYAPLRWQVLNTLRPPACTPPAPNRIGCFTLYPARSALLRLHTPRLLGCTASAPVFVSHGPSDRREIALTFDDGPWYDTPAFLSVLEREHVVATFFEIGQQISEFGEGGAIERRMLTDGDMIGDHTWSHPDVAAGGAFAAAQITATAAAIRRATRGFEPCLFRAPYGAVSGALIGEARALGFTTIQWNVDPRDWARPGVAAIVANVVANARPGSIVIQHDGGGDRSQTLAALPLEIGALRREGYQFVTVTQMLGERLIYS